MINATSRLLAHKYLIFQGATGENTLTANLLNASNRLAGQGIAEIAKRQLPFHCQWFWTKLRIFRLKIEFQKYTISICSSPFLKLSLAKKAKKQ